jgi:hypothetical protein
LSVFKINRSFFEPRQFATLLGIAGTAGYVASFAGFGPLQYLFNKAGYDVTLLCILGIGMILAVCAFLFIRPVQGQVPRGFVSSLEQLSVNKSFWIVSLIGGLIIWGTEGFSDGWSAPLLTSLFEWDLEKVVYVTSIIPVGFAVGSIVLPFLAKRYDNSKQLFGWAGLVSALALLGLFIPDIPAWFVFVLYVVMGCFAAYQVLCIDWGGKVVPSELSTLSSAATNMMIMSFGYLFHTVSSVMMSGKGVMDTTCGVLRYARMDLLIGLSPFIICGLIAYIINTRATYDRI